MSDAVNVVTAEANVAANVAVIVAPLHHHAVVVRTGSVRAAPVG